jgi:NAD(P)-dependent dehydrogenase (short-subunit alcohol dehydrogenase family)
MTDWSGIRGKRVVITGATNGIGLAAVKQMAPLGANLCLVARSPERAHAVAADLKPAQVDIAIADLASQRDVRRLADELLQRYARIDVLVNNAGAIFSSRRLSEDGIELTWAVNHLAPFLLTNLLLDRLKASAPARIITTASGAHRRAEIPFDDLNAERGYSSRGYARYGETKLANILFTLELGRRLAGSGVTANCFHPGFVASGFNLNNGALMRIGMSIAHLFARRPARGAETLVWLADDADVGHINGAYFVDKQQLVPGHRARDREAARRLWEVSEGQVGAAQAPRAASPSSSEIGS